MITGGILFFFFFRLITGFVETIYAFGLLGTDIPPEIAAVLLLFAPALLFFRKSGLPRIGLLLLGELILVAGAAEAVLDTRGRMFVSGIGLAAFLLFLPTLLFDLGKRRNLTYAWTLGAGLALGLALAILFRAWNSGVNPVSEWAGQGSGLVLASIAGLLLPGELRRLDALPTSVEVSLHRPASARIAGLSLGIFSTLVLLYFAFASPNVIARWTGANYTYIFALIVTALSLFAVLFFGIANGRMHLPMPVVVLWNLLFVAFLVWTILPHQIRFPADPGSYPFFEPPAIPLAILPLYGMLLLFPVILLDFILFCRGCIEMQPGIQQLAGSFTLAALYLLLAIFSQVFTTVYDYIPVIGPLFRDRFWLVFLIPGLVLVFTAIFIPRVSPAPPVKFSAAFVIAVVVVSSASFAGALLTAARPLAPPQNPSTLRVLTYNIQQGYGQTGQRSYIEQLELMRQVDADIIGLQESDTNRISGGNADLVRYFADGLDMHSYYGPKVVPGTFGIALLSKYPLKNPRTFYLFSEGEQTAAISAEITAGGKVFHVFVTHLGNDGPLVQQENFLQALPGSSGEAPANVIAMGDFNFTPNTEQYRRTQAVLQDAWLQRWPDGQDSQGNNPTGRIDHVFLSPGLEALQAQYLFDPASDHPALVVEVNLSE